MTDTKYKPGETYLTRDGRKARIYATDSGGEQPIHGAWFDATEQVWVQTDWCKDGKWLLSAGGSNIDLMPPLRECWRVGGMAFDTLEAAETFRDHVDVSDTEIVHYREVRHD